MSQTQDHLAAAEQAAPALGFDAALSAARQVAETVASLKAELKGVDENIATREAELAFHHGAPLPPEDVINFLDEYVDSCQEHGRKAISGTLERILYPDRSGPAVPVHLRKPLGYGEMAKILGGALSGTGLGGAFGEFPLPLPNTYGAGAFATQALILMVGAQIKEAYRRHLEETPIQYRNVRQAEIGLPMAERRKRIAELDGELTSLRSSKAALEQRIVQLSGMMGVSPMVALEAKAKRRSDGGA